MTDGRYLLGMRLGKLTIIAVCASLLLTIAEPATAVSSGAKCTRPGRTTSTKGLTYTCTKVGKTSVWKISSRAPLTSPAVPESTDPFAQFGKHAARFRALDTYGKTLVAKRKPDVPALQLLLQSPNDPAVIRMTQNAQYAYSVYQGMMDLGYVPLWLVGEKSDWLLPKIRERCPNMAQWMEPNMGGGTCRMTAVWRGVDVRDDEFMRNVMLVQGGHEIFHLYMHELQGRYWERVPDWLREGAANVGMIITVVQFDGGKTFANYGLANVIEGSPRDKATCQTALADWEANAPSKGHGYYKNCEYGLGLVMNEYLIMQGHTLADVLETYRLIGTGLEFPAAFEQAYKMPAAQFFADFRKYLATLDYGW